MYYEKTARAGEGPNLFLAVTTFRVRNILSFLINDKKFPSSDFLQ